MRRQHRRATHAWLRRLCAIAVAAATLAHVPTYGAVDWTLVHDKTAKAIDQLYDLDFPAAETTCNDVIRLAPGDPRGHFFKAMVYYYRMSYRGGASNDSAYWAFSWHVDRVKQVCERLLDKNDVDGKAKFYLGGIIGYKGLAQIARDETLNAIWDGKKGYDLLEEAVEHDPQNYDAKMGLGLFRYLISQAPSELQSVISIAGLKGDRMGGLRMLEEAATKGTYARQEARRWLFDLYQGEDAPQRALQHVQWLKDTYRRNWYFRMEYADIAAFQMRDIERAEPVYRSMLEMSCHKIDEPYVRFLAHYRLGTLSEARERYGDAIEHFKRAYEHANSVDRKRQAMAAMRWCDRLATHGTSTYDAWVRTLGDAPTITDRIPTNEELIVDRVSNAYGVGLHDRVVSLTDSLRTAKVVTSSTLMAQMFYCCGVSCIEIGQYARAEYYLREAAQQQTDDRTAWIKPFAHLKLGVAAMKQDKTAAAQQHLEHALTYKDFPSENMLRLRVSREMGALRKKR